MSDSIRISHVTFKNYKAFRSFSISFQQMNILVGPNNCGKSTIIGAFRILEVAFRKARSKSSTLIETPVGQYWGHELSSELIPVSLENIHTNYSDEDTNVTFFLTNKNKMTLYFPKNGGCMFVANSDKFGTIRTPVRFKSEFPLENVIVPIMGPVEHEEEEVTLETVKNGVSTHRASRHFRNYWSYFPDDFDNFAQLIKETWKGIEIERPAKLDPKDSKLVMFCKENRIARELFWAGFGFQIWCQLLTHISRAKNKSMIVIDEPEIYLHPEVQRQLINILRDLGIDVLIATHSTEILSESDASEILLVDKDSSSAKRLKDVEEVQSVLEQIGSLQNITLTQLARNKKILFHEGHNDFKFIRRFAKKLSYGDLSLGTGFTAIESKGFSSWERIKHFAWGFKTTLSKSVNIITIFDRDYWCDEEVDYILQDLSNIVSIAHIHKRKEIENYLLVPSVLQRALTKTIREKKVRIGIKSITPIDVNGLLETITNPLRGKILAQYIAKRLAYLKNTGTDNSTITTETIRRFDERWGEMRTRIEIVPGKVVLSALRTNIQELYGVSLTDYKIIDEFSLDEIPNDLLTLISNLESFRL
ncbi:MAG: AAA family ATPase [Ignavibacteriales bacterium]|nr:AAA family ATPase [Ignavibacteriales bacterium]